MNDKSIPYYPYRMNKIIITFVWAMVGLSLGLIYLTLISHDYLPCILLMIIDVAFVYWIIAMHFAAQTHIVWDATSIHIYENNTQECIMWDKVQYKYYSCDFKGHQYLILSCIALERHDIKKRTNQSAMKSLVCFDNGCVIYLDPNQPQLVQSLVRRTDGFIEHQN